jgi:hypothetical protein
MTEDASTPASTPAEIQATFAALAASSKPWTPTDEDAYIQATLAWIDIKATADSRRREAINALRAATIDRRATFSHGAMPA